MKLNKKIYFLFIPILFFPLYSWAQSVDPYTFPISPGKKNYLAGTMGELRSSHFHAGIDIKTGGIEGLKVQATQRGYITRIKVSTSGYGNALYMLHPDGNTSVYAHLKSFSPDIESYVKKAQYEQQTFEIELFPEPYQFAFKQGETLGLSGNTGGSTGPHLHFEIRDAQQRVLNPLHYGFNEIKDNIPPIVQGLALRPMDHTARIAQRYERKNISLLRNGFNYFAKDTVPAYGQIGIELLGHDKLNGAANKNGISRIETYINDSLLYTQNIDVINFALQRNILVHYPYEIKQTGGGTFHKLYIDDGNELPFYTTARPKGHLKVQPDELYSVKIKMYDPYDNQSQLSFLIKGQEPEKQLKEKINFELDGIDYQVENEVLKVYAQPNCENEEAELSLLLPDSLVGLKPAYYLDKTHIYLWPLKNGIPKSMVCCELGMPISIEKQILPLQSNVVSTEHMSITFDAGSVFDTLYFSSNYELVTQDSMELFNIGDEKLPLKNSIKVDLYPQYSGYDKQRSHVYKTDDSGNFSFTGGEWKEEKISFSTRDFGRYTIATDTVPPIITNAGSPLIYKVKDELSGIKSIKGSFNGDWVLLKYEPKDDLIWIEWLDAEVSQRGELIIQVEDNAGNINTFTSKIKIK